VRQQPQARGTRLAERARDDLLRDGASYRGQESVQGSLATVADGAEVQVGAGQRAPRAGSHLGGDDGRAEAPLEAIRSDDDSHPGLPPASTRRAARNSDSSTCSLRRPVPPSPRPCAPTIPPGERNW